MSKKSNCKLSNIESIPPCFDLNQDPERQLVSLKLHYESDWNRLTKKNYELVCKLINMKVVSYFQIESMPDGGQSLIVVMRDLRF